MKRPHTSILIFITSMFPLTASAVDWPQYGGPDGRWVANAGDHEDLKVWSKARLVWTSETAEIGPGRGQAPRYGFRNADPKGINHWGGAASPIIADGTLYQVYLRPVGDVYNKAVVDKIANDKRHSEREGFSIEHLRRNVFNRGRDCRGAIDEKTGKAVWTQAIRGVQSSGDYATPRGSNTSPAAGDGKVFVLGYDFVLRAHDAKTGKVLWQTKQPEGYARNLQIMLKSGAIGIRTLNSKRQPTTKTSATALFAPPLRYADGVVLYSLNSNTLIAVDGETGKELWQAKNSIVSCEVVAIWRRDESVCFIAVNRSGTVVCREARSGKRLWELTGKGETFHPTVAGDLLLINETNSGGGQPVATLGCYRMSDSGAEQLWVNAEEQELTHAAASVRLFHSGRFIIGSWAGPLSYKDGKKQGRAALRFFDAKTGKVDEPLRLLPDVDDTSLAPDSMATLVGDLLYVENDSHHQSNTTRTIIDLKTNKVLAQYKAPFVTAGGYGGTVINQPILDGRFYLRCSDGLVRCYDVTAN